MSRSLLTPPPWTIIGDDPRKGKLASLYTGIIGPNGERIVSDRGGICAGDNWTRDQIKAHVRLIAAAPKLLSELERLIAALENIVAPIVLVGAKDVIAKAKGGVS